MSSSSKHYEDTCTLVCTDNGKSVESEILDFKEEKFLSVAVARQMKVNLQYVAKHHIYVGSSNGYEFTTPGPKIISVNLKRGH